MNLQSQLTMAIPVYNDVLHLRETLESAVHQAGTVWIYDNCSTDGSSEIAAEFAARYEHITHIRHEQNLGAVKNFEIPLIRCETEFFMWLGAHDLLSDNFTLNLLKGISNDSDAALVVGDIQHINEQGEPVKKFTRLSEWDKRIQSPDPLTRMAGFISEHFGPRHDSFLYHGIYRTVLLKKAWISNPIIAADDAILTRVAVLGKIIHVSKATLYARRFTASRPKGKKEEERAAGSLIPAQESIERSRRAAVLSIIEMIVQNTRTMDELPRMFKTLRLVEHYVVKPSRARRRRRIRRILITLLSVAALSILASILM